MSKLRSLSGDEVVDIFKEFGFIVAAQRGSHVKLQRIVENHKQAMTVPRHAELDKGTIKAIYRQALRYLTEQELKPHFYSE